MKRYVIAGLLCLAVWLGFGGSASAHPFSPSNTSSTGRSANESKVVFIYALPADGTARYDIGTVATRSRRTNDLLGAGSGGYGLRVDRDAQGRPMVTQIRLPHSAGELYPAGGWAVNTIASDLASLGFPAGNVYAVYYDGPLYGTCGVSTGGGGRVAVLALQGGCVPDFGSPPAPGVNQPEWSMLHELLHAMGMVRRDAPHATDVGGCCHVNDDPNDLLYNGPGGTREAVLDADKQDYWWDLIGSPFVVSGQYRKLNATVSGSGSLIVEPPPALATEPVSCSDYSPCELWFPANMTVNLRAEGTGVFLTGWGGACGGRGACSVVMDGDKSVSATFVPLRELTIKIVRQRTGKLLGKGRIRVVGRGICPQRCFHELAPGAAVTLRALPAKGSRFVGWRLAAKGCKSRVRCTVRMGGNRTATAVFAPVRARR